MKQRKSLRLSCDVGKSTEGLENELWRRWSDGKAHSPTLPSLYQRHSLSSNPSVTSPTSSSFSNPSFASPTSQALHLRHLASRPCSFVWMIIPVKQGYQIGWYVANWATWVSSLRLIVALAGKFVNFWTTSNFDERISGEQQIVSSFVSYIGKHLLISLYFVCPILVLNPHFYSHKQCCFNKAYVI